MKDNTALAALVPALATLYQDVFGTDRGLDELLFRDTAKPYHAIAGRMSHYSAAAFGAIGFALVLLPSRWLQPAVMLMASPGDYWKNRVFCRALHGLCVAVSLALKPPARSRSGR